MNSRIVQTNSNYTDLLCYKKAVVIYDLTYHFCSRFIDKRDRTHDQMIQAARSGKQNIVEGIVDKSTSYEMAIKLLNVARGSQKELLEDLLDYLRVRNLNIWASNSEQVKAMRKFGIENDDSQRFIKLAESRNDEVVANMVIVLICQADVLLDRYENKQEEKFVREGGFRQVRQASGKR